MNPDRFCVPRRPARTRELDELEFERKPRPRTIITSFSDVELVSGWCRRIELHARERFDVRLVIITSLGDLQTRIVIFSRDVPIVLRAIERARAVKAREFREDVGALALPSGAQFRVAAGRHKGRLGVTFQLVATDGSLHGKPKTLSGREFFALEAAVAELQRSTAAHAAP